MATATSRVGLVYSGIRRILKGNRCYSEKVKPGTIRLTGAERVINDLDKTRQIDQITDADNIADLIVARS